MNPLDKRLAQVLAMSHETMRGTPTQLMQAHLRGLLQRLRLTIPFVATGPELLDACFPSELQLDSTKWSNARLAMKMDYTSFFMLAGGVGLPHHATDGVFWYRFDEGGNHAPRPFEEMAAFLVPTDAPCRMKLQRWFDKADDLNSAIMAATKVATSFAGAMKHPYNVQHYWPDLYPFVANVGSGNRTFNKDIPKVPPHIAATARFEKDTTSKVIEMLTTATLLPDAQPDAWVGFHK